MNIVDYLSIGVLFIVEGIVFYNGVMEVLGYDLIVVIDGFVVYGKDILQFLLMKFYDGKLFSVGNGVYIVFVVLLEQVVDSFY